MRNIYQFGSLLGFDAREMSIPFNQGWIDCRSEGALIKKDIVKPLSVDTAVWDTVFDTATDQNPEAVVINEEFPKWIGDHLNIWSNLSELNNFCNQMDLVLPRPYWIIAISILEQFDVVDYVNSRSDFESLIHLNESEPSVLQDEWEFLGFDVADHGRLSGLTNCFFNEVELPYVIERYYSALNQYHLLTSLKQANAFRIFSNERVKEHAPFFVYGLFVTSRVDLVEQ